MEGGVGPTVNRTKKSQQLEPPHSAEPPQPVYPPQEVKAVEEAPLPQEPWQANPKGDHLLGGRRMYDECTQYGGGG